MDYNLELKRLQEQMAEKQRLEAKKRELKSQQKMLKSRVCELADSMKKEQQDVERMERTSLASVFYSILGKKEETLDREKAQAYAAKLKYDTAAQQLKRGEEDLTRIETQLHSLANCERQYKQLLQEKSQAVKASGSSHAQHLFGLEQEITWQESQKREICEALSAGNRALDAAYAVLSSLDSAENWGTFDLFGGGMIADLAKHSHLDEAQDQVEQLQGELCRFKTELVDVHMDVDMQVNVEGFLRFADYFFDGLFVDWAVLDKIKQSQGSVQDTIGQIEYVMSGLRKMDAATDEKLSHLHEEYTAVVMAANP